MKVSSIVAFAILSVATVILSCRGSSSTPSPLTPAVSGRCPTNYVVIAANANYGTAAFCLAKYEMKVSQNDGTPVFDGYNGGVALNPALYKPESRSNGVPWVKILYSDAVAECFGLGTGYHLSTLKEWQVAAREIESVATNWSGGAVGSGTLYVGNALSSIAATAVADGDAVNGTSLLSARDGTDGYVGTGKNATNTWGSGKEANRTYTLLSGEVIWDMSGNAREIVDIDGLGGTLAYTGPGGSTFLEVGDSVLASAIGTAVTSNSVSLTSNLFFPTNTTWTSAANNVGLVYVQSGARTGKVVSRGGNFNSGNAPGIYAGDWDQDATAASPSGSFRCVAPTQ